MILASDVGEAGILPQTGLARRAAFGRGLVCDDQTFAPTNQSDAADDAGAGELVFHPVAGERGDFEKVGAFVEQHFDAIAREEAAALDVTFYVFFAAAFG